MKALQKMKLTKDEQIELLNESIQQLRQENAALKLEVKTENTIQKAEVRALKYELKDFEFLLVKMRTLEKENTELKMKIELLEEVSLYKYNEGYASGFTDADERC